MIGRVVVEFDERPMTSDQRPGLSPKCTKSSITPPISDCDRAATLEELFREAAIGLFSLIVTNLDDVQPREQVKFELARREGQCDYLLFDWLNELLFTFDRED